MAGPLLNTPWRLENVSCPLCGASRCRKLGVRGNREHVGADPLAEPHIVTDVVRCLCCDFIYTNPMIRGMEHLEEAHYADAARYQTSSEGEASAMFRHRLELIARHKSPGLLLDVGCGKGEFLAEARAQGWRVTGIEPSLGLCLHAREVHQLDVLHGTLERSDIDLPAAADAVTLNHVLEHVEHPIALLQAIRKLLNPDGVLFIEVPNCDSYLLRTADAFFRFKGLDWSTRLSPLHPPFHRFGFTASSLRHALTASGFTAPVLATFSGDGRGYGGENASVAARLRNIASSALALFGNRELLTAIARPLR